MGAKEGESKKQLDDGCKWRPLGYQQFVHRVLMTVGIVILFGLLVAFFWQTFDILLLVFAGILFGLILDAAAGWVSRLTHLKHGWALFLTILLILSVFGGVGMLAAP